MRKFAVISQCGSYRYELHRIWDESKPLVMFIMLNPSTADADNDDPTIRRCIGFAKSWGYGGIMVGNLFAYRATDPKELLSCEHPEGFDNKWHLIHMAARAKKIVCAWGNSPIVKKLKVKSLDSENLFCIKLSPDGTPMHPLYLLKHLSPIPFNRVFEFKRADAKTAKYLRARKYRLHNGIKRYAKVSSKNKCITISEARFDLMEQSEGLKKYARIIRELQSVYSYTIQYTIDA